MHFVRLEASEQNQNKGNKRPLSLYMQETKERKRDACQSTVQDERKENGRRRG